MVVNLLERARRSLSSPCHRREISWPPPIASRLPHPGPVDSPNLLRSLEKQRNDCLGEAVLRLTSTVRPGGPRRGCGICRSQCNWSSSLADFDSARYTTSSGYRAPLPPILDAIVFTVAQPTKGTSLESAQAWDASLVKRLVYAPETAARKL